MARPSKYKHPLKHYTSIYGVCLGSIQRYAKLGYPLDDEEATRAQIACQKYQPAPSALPADEPAAGKPLKTRQNARQQALGLPASIQRLREAEAAASVSYAEATGATKGQKQKEWLALVEQLRKVEQSSPDIAEANNKAINADELELSLSKTFNVFRQELENLPRRMEQELVGKDIIAIRETLTKEVEGIIATLHKCQWLKDKSD
jgi:hypothetical protein